MLTIFREGEEGGGGEKSTGRGLQALLAGSHLGIDIVAMGRRQRGRIDRGAMWEKSHNLIESQTAPNESVKKSDQAPGRSIVSI